jgi:hypothetical protein
MKRTRSGVTETHIGEARSAGPLRTTKYPSMRLDFTLEAQPAA